MDYLDYVQMTKGQQISYNIKSFFTGIPGAIAGFFQVVANVIKGFFGWIGNGFKGYGQRFSDGDTGTKLSYVIMGAGNMMHKQLGKGLVFLAVEVLYIMYMVNFGMTYVSKIYSDNVTITDSNGVTAVHYGVIGSNTPVYGYDDFGEKTLLNRDNLDTSNNVLLFFVVTLLITIAFFALYIANTKSAYETEQLIKAGKTPMTGIEEIKDYFDERFHVTLLTIPVLGLLAFTVVPIIFTVFIAFTNYTRERIAPGELYWWVGFQNFAEVFNTGSAEQSATFGKILSWTLIWAFFATFSNFILGIILALMINKKEIKFKAFWRTLFIITAAVPQFVTLLLMKMLLGQGTGLNAMMGTTYPFLTDATWAKCTVIIVNIWVGVPFTMLSTSGILMNIPEDLYESARIDGANAVQQFTKITFPYIFFVLTPYLISSFVGNINNFNVIYFLTGGGPESHLYYKSGETDLLVTWLYKLTVSEGDYKLAAVIGIFVFLICAIGSLIAFNMSKASKNEEEFS